MKYIRNIKISKKYKDILRSKQGGSRLKSIKEWDIARKKADLLVGNMSISNIIMLTVGLYWGEGTKSQFNLINGDPYLIKIFIRGLYLIGVPKNRIKFSLRIYQGMDENLLKDFWQNFLEIKKEQFRNSEFIYGNTNNKLRYGMCRVTIIKPAEYFKLLMSVIHSIKQISHHSSMDRTRDS